MVWIESHQSLLTHRKTARLARGLGISKVTVIGHLHCFWWWCWDNAPEGDLSGLDAEDIADGACWEGDAEQFASQLVKAGFVDSVEGGWRVHDWDDYFGRLLAARRANAERQAKYRGKRNALRNGLVTGDVMGTSPLRDPATVPNRNPPSPPVTSSPRERPVKALGEEAKEGGGKRDRGSGGKGET